jgi:hypothetical protein
MSLLQTPSLPWRILLEKVIDAQQVNKFPTFYGCAPNSPLLNPILNQMNSIHALFSNYPS